VRSRPTRIIEVGHGVSQNTLERFGMAPDWDLTTATVSVHCNARPS